MKNTNLFKFETRQSNSNNNNNNKKMKKEKQNDKSLRSFKHFEKA